MRRQAGDPADQESRSAGRDPYLDSAVTVSAKSASRGDRPTDRHDDATLVPIEQPHVEGYDVAPAREVRRALRAESQLVIAYAAVLATAGDTIRRRHFAPIGGERITCDLINVTRNQLIEAKAGASRNEIRMAIGQLADYGRFLSPDTAHSILIGERPRADLLALLEGEGITAIWRDGDGFADNAEGRFT